MKPATLLIPTDHILMLLVKEFYGTRYHSGSFCLVNVGSGFHCLRNFFFFSYLGMLFDKHMSLHHAASHALRPFNAALRKVKEFGIGKRISDRPHAML